VNPLSTRPPHPRAPSEILHIRIPLEYRERIEREVVAGGFRSVNAYVRALLETFWKLQDEMASTIEVRAGADDAPRRIIHTLLQDLEDRLTEVQAAGLGRVHARLQALFDRMDVLQIEIEQAYRGYLGHTPEVPEDLRELQALSADRRFDRWLSAVARELDARTLEARASK
jgi:Arc/MetJ-type ribon-helix-helix transcriptional regulator